MRPEMALSNLLTPHAAAPSDDVGFAPDSDRRADLPRGLTGANRRRDHVGAPSPGKGRRVRGGVLHGKRVDAPYRSGKVKSGRK
jgi:hypothetical protein